MSSGVLTPFVEFLRSSWEEKTDPHDGGVLAFVVVEARMAEDEPNEEVVEPLPEGETEEEHDRIRRSNDLDQRMEHEGVVSRRNRGYDEAAHGRESDRAKG